MCPICSVGTPGGGRRASRSLTRWPTSSSSSIRCAHGRGSRVDGSSRSRATSYDVDWRFICLRIVNEEKTFEQDPTSPYGRVHGAGRMMLRAAAATKVAGGSDAVGRLYTELGNRLHHEGRSLSEIREGNYSLIDEAIKRQGWAATSPPRRTTRSGTRSCAKRRPSRSAARGTTSAHRSSRSLPARSKRRRSSDRC